MAIYMIDIPIRRYARRRVPRPLTLGDRVANADAEQSASALFQCPVAAWYCSITLAGIRPRSLTAMPWSLAHARTSPLRCRPAGVRAARRAGPRPALRACSTRVGPRFGIVDLGAALTWRYVLQIRGNCAPTQPGPCATMALTARRCRSSATSAFRCARFAWCRPPRRGGSAGWRRRQ